jgi:hypothetical protein
LFQLWRRSKLGFQLLVEFMARAAPASVRPAYRVRLSFLFFLFFLFLSHGDD